MKKYLHLACDKCNRGIDKLVDLTHFFPDKCVITLGCEGRLHPVQYRSDAQIATTPEAGITDWRPRGSTQNQQIKDAAPVFINTSTGKKDQLVLAVRLDAEPADSSTLVLPLQIAADTPKTYRQYVFRYETAFTTVVGVESGLEKKTLRFNAYSSVSSPIPDIVQVYVNGVQRYQGPGTDDFQVYDGTSASSVPPNTISFNTAIDLSGNTQVDVIVSQPAAISTASLSFFRNQEDESRASTGAWENVSCVEEFISGVWTKFYLFTCDVSTSTALTLNTILTASTSLVLNGTVQVSLANAAFLLARDPFSSLDRYTDISAPLTGMSPDSKYLKYSMVDNKPSLQVTESLLSTLYPPFRVNKFTYEKTIKTAVTGVTGQVTIDGNVIIGPDA